MNTVLENMPTTVKSFVRENPDDGATIVINARLSAEDRMKQYKHEIDHLLEAEVDSEETADHIEARAHRRS